MNFLPVLVIAFLLISVYAVLAIHRLVMDDRQLVRRHHEQEVKAADWWGVRLTGFAVVSGLLAFGVFFVKLLKVM